MNRRILILAAMLLAVAGCVLRRDSLRTPSAFTITAGPLLVTSDFVIARDHRLLLELESMRDYVTQELGIPPAGEPVHVRLFQSPRHYRAFMREQYPTFVDRRAIFVETDTELVVYAQWGDRVAEDLRHEVTHGYLHGVLPGLPLWVDEGLAEYFEVPQRARGLNAPHVTQLKAALAEGNWQPDPRRLATFTRAEGFQQLEYAESWAWIHWLLQSDPARRALLRQYLAAVAQRRSTPRLEDLILSRYPDAPKLLQMHLDNLPVEPPSPEDGEQ